MEISKTWVLISFLLSLLISCGYGQPDGPTKEKPVMLMNRIGPSSSVLYLSNADGTEEHKVFNTSGFDYHASFPSDGKWIVFNSERNDYGQADIYRVHPDGTGIEQLTDNPAFDDQASPSREKSGKTSVYRYSNLLSQLYRG